MHRWELTHNENDDRGIWADCSFMYCRRCSASLTGRLLGLDLRRTMKEMITEYGAVVVAMLAVAGIIMLFKNQLLNNDSQLMEYARLWLLGGR